ncbi:MAG: toll/interleukin-1 receptor domain-containing protein [Anaerolineae bacterium]|nr:toll/interleukin-1 receptor domain-containing protein [Anaerolineae bacterium]
MDIFISYRKTDAEKVQELASDLESLGHQVWYDKELRPGHAWWGSILENIRRCELFLAAVTPDMLDSEPCRNEYIYADNLRKRILPVVLKPVSATALPLPLARIHYVDYSQQNSKIAYKSLQKTLAELPAAQPLPNPLPVPPAEPISELNILIEQIRMPHLSDNDQAALVFKVKQFLTQPKYAEDARDALNQLRAHPELLGSVRDEIDDVLRRHAGFARKQAINNGAANLGGIGAPALDSIGDALKGVGSRLDNWVSGGGQGQQFAPAGASAGAAPSMPAAPKTANASLKQAASGFNAVAFVVGCITAFFWLFGVAHLLNGKAGQALRAFALGIGWFFVAVIITAAVRNSCVVAPIHLALVGYISWQGARRTIK